MQATDGSTRGSIARLSGICFAIALIALSVFTASASAKKAPLKPTNYIALGDSISYGYSQQKFEENYPAEEPSKFEGGFVNLLGTKLARLEKKAGDELKTLNLSCPGEVSDGLIGENPALGGGGTKNNGKEADDQPCGWYNVDHFPRHFEYGPISQLEAAVGIVTGALGEGALGTTKYVTLQIGSNDELAVVHACESEAYDAEHGFKNADFCLVKEAGEEGTYYSGGLFKHIIENLGDVVGVLRHEGFTGKLAILGFYNPQALILSGSDYLQKELNEHVEAEISGGAFGEGVVYANPMPKFNPEKSEKVERKAVCKYTEECNIHDKKVNEEKAVGHEVSEAEAEEYPEGDIHPTTAGHKWFAKILYEALTTGKSVG